MYVCIYMYIYICMYICIYMYIYIYTADKKDKQCAFLNVYYELGGVHQLPKSTLTASRS